MYNAFSCARIFSLRRQFGGKAINTRRLLLVFVVMLFEVS